jgi:ergothioneine biosynthesis protein EgtB
MTTNLARTPTCAVGTSHDLASFYRRVRSTSADLAAPLSAEDCLVQSMPDASPVKWHLAHTTWFFETFVLQPHRTDYRQFNPSFGYLFNSYYNSIGQRHPRPKRGLLTRPALDEVRRYRDYVDEQMDALLSRGPARPLADLVTLGLNHEQQHQELILTDIKHALSCNSLRPAYRANGSLSEPDGEIPRLAWMEFPGGCKSIGHEGEAFAFDNELPRHETLLQPFRIASRLVTNFEYRTFIQDGGYRRPELWLSDGWTACQERDWQAPLYWIAEEGIWQEFTLDGLQPLRGSNPVCHVSFYEADAFARWAGARLATEQEWESVAATAPIAGNFLESGRLRPVATPTASGLTQIFGDVWEWTASPYVAYPGYRPAPGALGEYNGKFMCNQFVMRGGSCATPQSHMRASYRNFFPPDARWQFTGVRLARDV